MRKSGKRASCSLRTVPTLKPMKLVDQHSCLVPRYADVIACGETAAPPWNPEEELQKLLLTMKKVGPQEEDAADNDKEHEEAEEAMSFLLDVTKRKGNRMEQNWRESSECIEKHVNTGKLRSQNNDSKP